MLEKMARAMCAAAGRDPDEITHAQGEHPYRRWQAYALMLRPALQSLKDLDEGTVEAMVQELRDARDYTDHTQALRVFTCGINHILRSGE